MYGSILRRFAAAAVCLSACLAGAARAGAQELQPEEIISKHLEAIGPKQKRDEVKNRLAGGRIEFKVKVPVGTLVGKALMVTENNKFYFISGFNSKEYPYERIGFFGNKPNVPFTTPGVRSPLGNFLLDNDKILSDGLIAGSMSGSWFPLVPDGGSGKLTGGGRKKLDGRDAYVLNYAPRGGSSELSIKLFFDAKTFQHVRTEYLRSIPPKDYKAGVMGQGLQNGAKNLMVEEFGDYREMNGLTLPFRYRIYLATETQTGTNDFEWTLLVSQYLFNQNLAKDFYTFEEAAKN